MTSGGTLVLLYHRVAHLDQDPHGLAVRPDRFAAHCETLRRRCEIVPLHAATGTRRQVAVTFDDGYADNAGEARRILSAAGIPATFFVTTGRLGLREEAWWDRLAQMLLEGRTAAGRLDVTIGGRRLWTDIRSASARDRAHLALFWRLRPMRPSAIESVLEDVRIQLGLDRHDRDDYRWMTADELRALASSEGIEIGAHTITHPFLATLDRDEQWQEIDGSRHTLERLLDTPVRQFSYPYGGPDAFDAVTAQLVRDAGFTMACTATGGLARAGGDPFRVPRNVVGDWDAEQFEQWLEGWLRQL